MSMSNLTIDGEFRYIVQWFNEWSELQREDFVPIIVNYITGNTDNDGNDEQSAALTQTTPVNMNGLQNDFELNGKPMSLFQCRIKLFNQWNRKWPIDFKQKLQQKITEIDGNMGEKIKASLKPNNGTLTNGCGSTEQSLEEMNVCGIEMQEVEPTNNSVKMVMTLNDPMTEVLNNETSVDDIETNEDLSNSNSQMGQVNNKVTITAHDSDDGNVDNEDCSNTKNNHAIDDREPVEQVVQIQNLQINEEDHKDVTAIVEHLQPVTVTVNPVVVTQTITTNAEVPLVV